MAVLIELLLRANLAAAAAILLVLALRGPARRAFGAEVAYSLWLAAPLAGASAFLPARSQMASALSAPSPLRPWTDPLADLLKGAAHFHLLPNLWLGGAAVMALGLIWGQARFLRRERAGQAGPAVVGAISPRFVVPADYETRFTAEEREIIRAHERTHLARGDAHTNALIAAAQVACWFNPLVHLAARLARQDQELACDAAVLKRARFARRRYAETLLKTQLATTALPLGCYWPAPGRHPLEERIATLRQDAPGPRRRWAGQAAVVVLALAAGGGGWLLKPVHVIAAPAARPARTPDPTMLFLIYRHAPAPASPRA